ncbi:hypothetical protein ERUR111494_02620 [Erysipelothrix urinaevulpis]
MDDFIKNIMTLVGVIGVVTGILVKQLKATNETNNQLERLNTNMEHQFTLFKKDVNNNSSILNDNFAIVNGELVELKKVVFDKDKGSPLPLREVEKI